MSRLRYRISDSNAIHCKLPASIFCQFYPGNHTKKNSLADLGHWDKAVGFQLQTLGPLGYSARAVHKSKLLRKLLAKNLARNTT